MKKLPILIALTLLLSGCSTFLAIASHPLTKTAVEQATMRWIRSADEPADRAKPIIEHGELIAQAVGITRAESVDEFQDVVKNRIPWSDMSEADRRLWSDLIDYIADFLRTEVEAGNIPHEDIRLYVSGAIRIVIRAAEATQEQ